MDREIPARVFGWDSARVAAGYGIAVLAFWLVGFEPIRGHLAPFYAVWAPQFDSLITPASVALIACAALLVSARLTFGTWPALPGALIALAAILALSILFVFRNQVAYGDASMVQVLRRNLDLLTWQLPVVVVVAASPPLMRTLARTWDDARTAERGPRARVVAALMLFALAFAAAVAMVRGGPGAIVQSYLRRPLEYIGDIGRGGSLRGLFANYETLRPALSMHSQTHPPGAVALMWLMSMVLGRTPWALALATMVLGTLSMLPLRSWVRETAGGRAALIACCLFALTPSIVLFTATSFDIVFLLFALLVILAFSRAMRRGGAWRAMGAGAAFALLTLLSFLLAFLAIAFTFAAIDRLRGREHRRETVRTVAWMVCGFVGLHLAVRGWSGFDVVRCFQASYAQFGTDRMVADLAGSGAPEWAWKLLNAAAWTCFAGIPVVALLLRTWGAGERDERAPIAILGGSLLAMLLAYPGHGESERAAMYALPFVLLPASVMLERLLIRSRSMTPLLLTCALLAAQCWCTESLLDAHW